MAKEDKQEELENQAAPQETEVEFEEVDGTAIGQDDLGGQIVSMQDYLEKNQNLLIGILVGVAAVVGGLWYLYQQKQEAKTKAQQEIVVPIFDFEKDSLSRALNGSPNGMGFLAIVDEYGSTPAGNLAHFYIGSIYLKQANFDGAIEHLGDFSSDDFLLNARGKVLLGDAYMEKQQFEDAVKAYQKASEIKPNQYYTPVYLLKLGIAQEAAGNLEGAVKAYGKIVDEYPKSAQVQNAKRYKALALSIIGNPEGKDIVEYYSTIETPQPKETGEEKEEGALELQPQMEGQPQMIQMDSSGN